jgi:hypothetical protein
MNTPVQIGIGWSTDTRNAFGLGIRYFTRPRLNPFCLAQWSHVFLVFFYEDATSTTIHEALMSDGWTAKPIAKLTAWINRSPDTHLAEIRWLPIAAPEVLAIHAKSVAWLGTKSYARRQIAAFMISNSMIGRWLNLSIGTGSEEVICSEGACQLIGETVPAWDIRTPGQSWDALSPQDAYDRITLRLDGPAPATA